MPWNGSWLLPFTSLYIIIKKKGLFCPNSWYKYSFYRLKFSPGGSPLDWFISSDMFYLEVMLESTGGVKDVRIHHEGKVEQQVSVYHMRFEFLMAVFWGVTWCGLIEGCQCFGEIYCLHLLTFMLRYCDKRTSFSYTSKLEFVLISVFEFCGEIHYTINVIWSSLSFLGQRVVHMWRMLTWNLLRSLKDFLVDEFQNSLLR